MARIPDAEIERLKNEVSVQRLVEASGIELKKSGKDFVGQCPFHEDATASLVVTPPRTCGTALVAERRVVPLTGSSRRTASRSATPSNCCAMAFLL